MGDVANLIPRPLSSRERAFLDALVEPEFPGAVELRRQAAAVEVSGGCACGCASVDFVLPAVRPGMRIITEAIHRDGTGEVILFTRHAHTGQEVLAGIECFWYEGDSMTQLPPPSEFEIRAYDPDRRGVRD